jgi:type IV pilus assembly protein PilW
MNMANPEFMQFRATFRSRGFGLIELMVAMTIGLILLGGIGYVFMGSKQTFRTQDDFSRIQENVRYALDTVGVDVRMAGYSGCVNLSAINPSNPSSIPINVVANEPPALLLGDALQGYVGATWTAPGTAPATWVSNTGVIHISRAAAQGVKLTGNMTTDNANIQIAGNPTGIVAEQLLIVSDCESADVFRAQNVSVSSGTVTIAHTNGTCGSISLPCNTDNRLSKAYSSDAELFGIVSTTYYIATNPAGNPALYRRPERGTAEELVENVEDIVMRFGIDTTNDFVVDSYVDAGGVTDWRQVLTARVSMVFRSNSNNVATQLQPCVVEYTSCTPTDATDRRLRQVATATFGIRNRLP